MVGVWYASGCACMCRETVTPLPTLLSVYILSVSVAKAAEQVKNNTSMHNPLASTTGIWAQNIAAMQHPKCLSGPLHQNINYSLVMWHNNYSTPRRIFCWEKHYKGEFVSHACTQNSSKISVIPRVGCTTLEVRTIREDLDLEIFTNFSPIIIIRPMVSGILQRYILH